MKNLIMMPLNLMPTYAFESHENICSVCVKMNCASVYKYAAARLDYRKWKNYFAFNTF